MSYPSPPPGYSGYGPPPEHPQSTLILVLGVLGLSLCGLCAPFAWVKSRKVLAEIDASGGQIGGRSQVYAGYVMGIVGTIVLGVAILSIVAGVLLLVVSASAGAAAS